MRPGMIATILAFSAGAAAAGPLEVGVVTGGHGFADDVELGVEDWMPEPGPASSALLGARLGVPLARRLAVEGELVVVPTTDDVLGDAATVFAARLQGVAYLTRGRLRPFVVAGAGVIGVRGGAPQLDDDVDRALHWGGGVRIGLTRTLAARLDLRHVIVPGRTAGGATSDGELQLGLTWTFGAAQPARVIAAPPPPAPPPVARDRDRDGLVDADDRCPRDAEDRDAFEDADGCPDPDNDGDQLADTVDHCPLLAESINGWNDDDGCPDEILAELAGIEFERGSARITSASRPILDRTVDILTRASALHVEISGHTSRDGDRDDNLALSRARAEAVAAYLIAHGVAADRLTAIGYGPDRPIADDGDHDGRRRNRRIEFRIVPPPTP
jgi:OOP family OmpA-OmpF porin